MNRFWGHTLSVTALALVAGSSVPACAHDDASLFVQAVLAPPVPSGGTCTYVPNATAAVLSNGVVDAAILPTGNGYGEVLLVGNTLIPQGNATIPNSETSRIEVQGAIIQVIDPASNATVENNSVLTAGEVDPASGSAPSYAAIGVQMMSAAAVAHFAPASGGGARVALVYVTLYGQTLGGQNIQSNQFQWPVNICSGCLVSVPAGSKTGYCQGDTTALATQTFCSPGVDQSEDCQFCYPLSVCNRTP